VVIAGRPNVGKSSLINALVGFSRSIVYDRPGTTRDVVTAETALDGWPIRFSDTAGLRNEGDAIEMAGMERARATLATADCRILVFDTSREPHADDRRLLAEWPDAIQVAHKSDLPAIWGDAELDSALRVSSVVGTGMDELAEQLVSRLIPQVPAVGTAVPVCRRQVELLELARSKLTAADVKYARGVLSDLLR
jgi:tRNA modification GTPase